jgi:TonB family protein
MAARIRSILDAGTYRGSLTATVRRAGICALLLIVVPLAITQGQGRIHSIQEAGVTAPQLLWKQEPQYSPAAKAAKLQGTVRVAVVIAENGTISRARVVRGLEAGLDANAVAALKTWKFQPATKAGKPVKVRANVEVNYRLL